VLKPGAFASRQVLQASIVVLGTGLSLAQVAKHRPVLAAAVSMKAPAVPWRRMFLWFIVYFLASVAANSLGLIPHDWHVPLSQAAVFLITTAYRAWRKSAPVPGSCIGHGDLQSPSARALFAFPWPRLGVAGRSSLEVRPDLDRT
jgi:uncharacterized membrane protein YadS